MAADEKTPVAEQTTTAVAQAKKECDFSLGIYGTSDNFLMAMQMAKSLAASTIVPNSFQGNPSNCLIALEQAQRLQMSPFMVMQNLYVIQGRPSWSSQFLLATINASGKYDMEIQYTESKKDGKPFSCTCWTTKDGRRIEGMTVDMDMAKAEGWLDKNGSKWKTMPQLMLRYRAISFFARLNCPDITLGFYSQEELEDADFREITVPNYAEQMHDDVENNANATEFVPDEEPKASKKSKAAKDDTPECFK